jgi:hypothetical protein
MTNGNAKIDACHSKRFSSFSNKGNYYLVAMVKAGIKYTGIKANSTTPYTIEFPGKANSIRERIRKKPEEIIKIDLPSLEFSTLELYQSII